MDPNTAAPAPEADETDADKVDDAIMDFLTDEEREALDESDFLEEEGSTPEPEADPEPSPEPEAGADPEADPEPAQQAADPEPEPAAAEPAPKRSNVDIGELDQQIASFGEQRNELLDQYEDGDLTRQELQTKLEEIDQQADQVKAQRAVAQDAANTEMNDWRGSVQAHLTAYPELKGSEDVLTAFDAAVRSVTGNPMYAHMTNKQQLNAAHELLAFQAKHTGLQGVPALKGSEPQPTPEPTPDPTPDPKPQAKATEPAKDGDKPDMRTPPVTLANTPASDISGGSDSPYAALERLAQGDDPIAFEQALMKLTPEQRDEFSSMDIG